MVWPFYNVKMIFFLTEANTLNPKRLILKAHKHINTSLNYKIAKHWQNKVINK